eukprot:6259694-Amphidinium_carterae.1
MEYVPTSAVPKMAAKLPKSQRLPRTFSGVPWRQICVHGAPQVQVPRLTASIGAFARFNGCLVEQARVGTCAECLAMR